MVFHLEPGRQVWNEQELWEKKAPAFKLSAAPFRESRKGHIKRSSGKFKQKNESRPLLEVWGSTGGFNLQEEELL